MCFRGVYRRTPAAPPTVRSPRDSPETLRKTHTLCLWEEESGPDAPIQRPGEGGSPEDPGEQVKHLLRRGSPACGLEATRPRRLEEPLLCHHGTETVHSILAQ